MPPEMPQPMIIVAPNGARRMKTDHSALPITPQELAETAITCADSGAAIIHMHARTVEGRHSLEIDDNRRTYNAVKSAVGDRMIVQMTTEAVGIYQPEHQMALIRVLKPEAASFGLRELIPNPANLKEASAFFHWVAEQRILAQYILYSAEDLSFYRQLIADGLLPTNNHHLLFVLGRYTQGQQSSPADLDPFIDQITELNGVRWAVCAFGSEELNCLIHAVRHGGDARIGFENNLFSSNGEVAKDNSAQVQDLCKAIVAEGLSPLTAAEVRTLFNQQSEPLLVKKQ